MGSAVLRNCLNIFLDHRNKDSEEDEVPSPLPVLSRGCQLSATILSWQRVCLHLLWQDSLRYSRARFHFCWPLTFWQSHPSGNLSVLAILGHESVIPIVIEYIEGKAHGVSLGGRKMAIYSLADVAMKYRNTLMPVFAALFHNPSEERGVRIAAFSMMM